MPSDKSQPDEHKAKKPRTFRLWAFAVNGRRGGIRTRDPLHPMHLLTTKILPFIVDLP